MSVARTPQASGNLSGMVVTTLTLEPIDENSSHAGGGTVTPSGASSVGAGMAAVMAAARRAVMGGGGLSSPTQEPYYAGRGDDESGGVQVETVDWSSVNEDESTAQPQHNYNLRNSAGRPPAFGRQA